MEAVMTQMVQKMKWNRSMTGYLFISPFMILFIIFTVIPVAMSLGLSFTNFNMLQPPKWVGLTNLRRLLLEDDVFLIALKNTIIFALISGPTGYIGSFLAAWVINGLKLRNAFSLAFYAPSITSSVAMSVIWLYFFSSDRYGFINNIIIKMGLTDTPIMWNSDPKYIMFVVIIVSVWMSMGTGFLVFLAGFQNVPEELYDAGKIDGIKSKFQELWYIILPVMKPQLLFGAVTSIVSSFAVFDITVAITGVMPSPDYCVHTIVAHLYDYAFIRFDMGYASEIALILFILTFSLGRITMKLLASKDE
jgi:multiple sugar transport system permease protein